MRKECSVCKLGHRHLATKHLDPPIPWLSFHVPLNNRTQNQTSSTQNLIFPNKIEQLRRVYLISFAHNQNRNLLRKMSIEFITSKQAYRQPSNTINDKLCHIIWLLRLHSRNGDGLKWLLKFPNANVIPHESGVTQCVTAMSLIDGKTIKRGNISFIAQSLVEFVFFFGGPNEIHPGSKIDRSNLDNTAGTAGHITPHHAAA